MLNIYLGGPLFSESERRYNSYIANKLRHEFYAELYNELFIYVPQENDSINDKSGYADSIAIAKADTKRLLESDLLIALLDGPVIDVGLASEIGVAYANNIPIIGLYSDVRQGTYGNELKIQALDEIAESQFSYANLYTIGLIKLNGEIVKSSNDLVEAVRKRLNEKRNKMFNIKEKLNEGVI